MYTKLILKIHIIGMGERRKTEKKTNTPKQTK